MIRRGRPDRPGASVAMNFTQARAALTTRRRFLIQAAGGSVALLFGLPAAAQATTADPWQTLDAVTRHLLPSEPDSPGAADIHALDYLRFVVADPWVAQDEREFLVQGNTWLEQRAHERHKAGFVALTFDQKERLLRQIAATPAGENWLSTLLTYLFEALLTAPAYGGNFQQAGWRWLDYIPGFPLPGPGTRYPELPL